MCYVVCRSTSSCIRSTEIEQSTDESDDPTYAPDTDSDSSLDVAEQTHSLLSSSHKSNKSNHV